MIDINDSNCFYISSDISNGLPKIGMEDDDYLLFRPLVLIGDNDNEYHQREFIHVDLTDNYTTLVVRLTVHRTIRNENYGLSMSNHYDFTCDTDYEHDGPSGIENKLIGLFIKMYKKTHNRVKEEDISFISTILIAYLTKFTLLNNSDKNNDDKKRYLTKEEVEKLIDEKLSELNKRLK